MGDYNSAGFQRYYTAHPGVKSQRRGEKRDGFPTHVKCVRAAMIIAVAIQGMITVFDMMDYLSDFFNLTEVKRRKLCPGRTTDSPSNRIMYDRASFALSALANGSKIRKHNPNIPTDDPEYLPKGTFEFVITRLKRKAGILMPKPRPVRSLTTDGCRALMRVIEGRNSRLTP